MNLEWDVDFLVIPSVDAADTTPGLPDLPLNTPVTLGTRPLGIFLLDSAKCQMGSARRITRNNLAQADGELTHRKFKTGYVMELATQLWERVDDPACAGTLREMADLLAEYLEAMANNNGQVVWFPSPWPADAATPNPRVLDRARSMGPSGNDSTGSGFVSVATQKDENAKLWEVTFAFLSPFPYVTDYMDWPTSPDAVADFAEGADGSTTVANEGTVPYHPVLRIYGDSLGGDDVDGFTLTNNSVVDEIGDPLQIVYDQNNPGGFPISPGFWIEIDTFLSTVQMKNNAGTHTANAKPGINVLKTDFFQLDPGNNDLDLAWHGPHNGLKAEVIYRNAWA